MATQTEPGKVTKALYAAVGAPVVAGRRAKGIGTKVAGYGTKVADGFSTRYTEWAVEGEDVTKHLQERRVVEDFQEKVDLEHLQERVGKLRDQLEHTMVQWRESFTPATKPAAPKQAEKPKPAAKPAAKATASKPKPKSAAKKTTTTKQATAKKQPAAKKSAAKKPAAKKTTASAASSKAADK